MIFQLGKRGLEECLKISQDGKLRSDLLKTKEDLAPKSRRILRTLKWYWARLPQHGVYVIPLQ